MPTNSSNNKAWPSDNPARTSTGAKTLTYQTRTTKMAPATEPTTAAAGRKRKKPHGPSKTLAKKPSGPKSTSGKKKEKHKHTTHKEKKPRPTGPPAKKPDEPDQVAAGDGGGVLLSAAMPPARQLEFLLRSFERAVKMRLSPLELDSYSGLFILMLNSNSTQSNSMCQFEERNLKACSVLVLCRRVHGPARRGTRPGRGELW